MFTKLLIANRGEIACRIMKTAKRLGLKTIAVYSTADKDACHTRLADEAYCIGEAPSAKSYLNIDAIIKAALISGAQAIHPGYGFLSENPDFAAACAKSGIAFVGPSIDAMNAMSSKQLAKQRLEKTDVPLTPGYHGTDQSDELLLREAKNIGFPVLLKAAAGGGGKGMRAVDSEKKFLQALAGARRESKSSFGDDTMIIEKLIKNPRHIEIQIIADNHGNTLHLFDRDCSIQRRHQKIIEEAPAPNIPKQLHEQMAKAAITVAKAIDYQGAGTIEFLLEDNKHFYFMEMNTRLQVEHPVSELITGIDLVEWQLKVAANESLPCKQEDINIKGHAVECRIYAEDPQQNFLPSIGTLTFLREPQGENIRIDTGVIEGSEVSMHYDPMIAKLITFGDDRSQAVNRMDLALTNYHIGGVKTNLAFLKAIIEHPDFIHASLSTDFLTKHAIKIINPDPHKAIFLAASIDYLLQQQSDGDQLTQDAFGWQMNLQSQWNKTYIMNKETYKARITPITPNQLSISLDDGTVHYTVSIKDQHIHYDDGHQQRCVYFTRTPKATTLFTEQGPAVVKRHNWEANENQQNNDSDLIAPMPSTVVAVLKQPGEEVKAGDTVMVLEAMKMEHTITAPKDGLIDEIFFNVGHQVAEGAELLSIKAPEVNKVT
jgi:3-methylcrotonyl-CoA carboxylase alpha subunit